MALDISFDQFNSIASGDHNAGQIDYETSRTGISLKKVNHHVICKSLNKATVAAERTVELKRAFVSAMTTQLGGNAAAIAEIRKSLGLPPDETNPKALSARTIEPLTRQEVRELIDKYVNHLGGDGTATADADRESVNVENARRLPIVIGGQSFYLDQMVNDLKRAAQGAPSTEQVNSALRFLSRPDGKMDVESLARALNVFAYVADREAAAGDGAADADTMFSQLFARALDSLDNGTLSQVYQGILSRETDALKSELSRRLAKFDLTVEQADACERTALALGRLEALVVSEISHRIALGKATTESDRQLIAEQAPVLHHCGENVERDLSARGGEGEMTSVNLEILTTRAAYGNINEERLAGKVSKEMCANGFTQVDTHDIGDMLRRSELTINTHLSNLLGWRQGQNPDDPPLYRPGYSLVNTFVSKEQKGIAKDATGGLVRRDAVERHYFPEYDRTQEFRGRDRPVYAAFNLGNAKDGGAPMYGGVVLVVREHVKQQATYTIDDTFYAVKCHFGEGARDKFLAKISARLGNFLDDGAFAALRDVATAGGACVDRIFRGNAGKTVTSHAIETLIGDIVQELNAHRREGARPIEKDDVNAAFMEALGVENQELSRVAGYDNIENLLAGTGDTMPVAFGVTTLRRIADPGAPVKMCGCDYIEAQLHGPIVVSRDIEEMRVPSDEIRSHYSKLYEADSSVAGGMDKDAWIASKTAADMARLVKFGKDNGFKVTFYGDKEVSLFGLDRDALREDIEDAKNILRPHSHEFAKSLFAGDDLAAIIGTKFKDLSADRRKAVERAFGENFSRAPQSVIALFGGECKKVIDDIDDPEKEGMHDRSSIRDSAERHVLAAMEHVADGLLAAEENGEKDPVRLASLIKAAVGVGVRQPRIRVFVIAQIAKDNIAPDLSDLVNDALAEELAGRVEEVAAMGLGNKFAVGGQALTLLLQQVQAYLASYAASIGVLSVRDVSEVKADVRKEVVVPFLRKRLDVLKKAGERPFADEILKGAYYGWAMSGKRIKSPEEANGVRECAENVASSLGSLLAAEKDFSLASFMAAYQDFARQLDAACQADAKAHPDGEFGPDDRNGYIFRGVSIALAAIEQRYGRAALEKLCRVMSAREFTAVFAATGAATKFVSYAQSVSIDTFNGFVHMVFDRLSTKYGIGTGAHLSGDVEFSQIPPDTRAMASIVNPGLFEELNVSHPFAPSSVVAVAMPAPSNAAAAPQTLAERKRALFGALPAYGSHEKSFENGRNIHGRGHATRVFVFANVLGNIMRERGVNVDMGSLSISAAGHDMGRKGSGTDYWEKQSGQLVENLAETTYPGAYGDDWKMQTNLNVSAGHGAQADAQRTVEGLLMKAADSLDYTRVDRLDPRRFHFLEKTLNVGGVHVMQDDALRKALMHEAELLTKATSPLAANREKITRLKTSNDEKKILEGRALEADVTEAEKELAQLSDEQVVERIEAEIRDNPTKYPLLNKYYFYDQE